MKINNHAIIWIQDALFRGQFPYVFVPTIGTVSGTIAHPTSLNTSLIGTLNLFIVEK